MRVGLDSYAYHRYFGDLRPGETAVEHQWTVWDFLDRAAELQVDGVALQTCFLTLEDVSFRRNLRNRLEETNIDKVVSWGHPYGLEMGMSGTAAADLIRTLSCARELACTTVRVVIGHQRYWKQEPESQSIERLLPVVEAAADHADELGIVLAIENHCELTISGILKLLEAVQRPNVGVTLDTANVIRIGEDLIDSCRQLAALTRVAHLKDLVLEGASFGDPDGWWPCAPLGKGDLDLPGVLNLLWASGFDGLLCIEMGEMHPDFPDEDAAVMESVKYLRACGATQGTM
jgi:sugar phosphate isomerase/epimerase